jgi:hypothetical protein
MLVDPLIAILALVRIDTPILASFDFSSSTASLSSDQHPIGFDKSFIIRRFAVDTDQSNQYGHKTFDPNSMAQADPDISGMNEGTSHFWLRVYALAYGINDSFQTFYSLPQLLGHICLQ